MPKVLTAISHDQLKKLKPFLDEAVKRTEQSGFIEGDPVSFIHAFDDKEDKALAGFFAALFSWGQRNVILEKTENLLQRMNYNPSLFIRNFEEKDRQKLVGWKHRTFKPVDIYWLIKSLKKILFEFDSFEVFWKSCYKKAKENDAQLLTIFHHQFFSFYPQIPKRTYKHIASPHKNSACKRLCMYLRWVIRKNSAVDPGIMNFMSPSELFIPLDVHAARQARALGLLTRTYNDWKAVTELTENLRKLDPDDPTKYDFALFGIGVNGRSIPKKFVVNPSLLTSGS